MFVSQMGVDPNSNKINPPKTGRRLEPVSINALKSLKVDKNRLAFKGSGTSIVTGMLKDPFNTQSKIT
jgi:hypothetical protein